LLDPSVVILLFLKLYM